MPTHLQLANKLMEDFARSGDDERISYYNTDDGRRISRCERFPTRPNNRLLVRARRGTH